VAVTGWNQEQDREATRQSGFDMHLTKPVELREIEGILDRFRRERFL
jgi:CheY-like chemotaxis protein